VQKPSIAIINYNEIFSLVVRYTSICVFLDLVTTLNIELEQLIVKTAFLHGRLEEDILVKQPKGVEVEGKENYVCRWKWYLYRLKQSPRYWYKRFD